MQQQRPISEAFRDWWYGDADAETAAYIEEQLKDPDSDASYLRWLKQWDASEPPPRIAAIIAEREKEQAVEWSTSITDVSSVSESQPISIESQASYLAGRAFVPRSVRYTLAAMAAAAVLLIGTAGYFAIRADNAEKLALLQKRLYDEQKQLYDELQENYRNDVQQLQEKYTKKVDHNKELSDLIAVKERQLRAATASLALMAWLQDDNRRLRNALESAQAALKVAGNRQDFDDQLPQHLTLFTGEQVSESMPHPIIVLHRSGDDTYDGMIITPADDQISIAAKGKGRLDGDMFLLDLKMDGKMLGGELISSRLMIGVKLKDGEFNARVLPDPGEVALSDVSSDRRRWAYEGKAFVK